MFSNYPYFRFIELSFKGTVPYMVFVFTIVLLVVIAQNPHEMLFSICVIYALSGPIGWIRKQIKAKRQMQAEKSERVDK